MVTVQDVRETLTKLSSERVPDETIEKCIELANTRVENERATGIPEQTAEDTRLVVACWLTLDAYVSQYERSVGSAPPQITAQLERWAERAETFLSYVRRIGVPPQQGLVAQPDTLITQSDEGLLDEDVY